MPARGVLFSGGTVTSIGRGPASAGSFPILAHVRRMAYILVQAVWGFPQTIAGLLVCAALHGRPHFRYHGAIVTTWDNPKGMALGPFVFLKGSSSSAEARASVDGHLLVHEYGHTVQSLLLGPLYLPVIGIPSFIWSNVPAFARKRHEGQLSYYAFAPERSANWLGEHVLGEPSVGQAVID